MKIITKALLVSLLLSVAGPVCADVAVVAVASNFRPSAQLLGELFSRRTGHAVKLSAGSSGSLYAQIVNGAPFDIFLSADQLRPDRLISDGHAVNGSQFDYAFGALVLWSNQVGPDESGCLIRLAELDFDRLAIANPAFAPYGLAAQQWLERMKLWDKVRKRLVLGQNIGQTYAFVVSGNATLGLVAASQLRAENMPEGSCRYAIPASEHEPIAQRGVLLNHGKDNKAALSFMKFLRSAEALHLIRERGYAVPPAD